MLAPKMPAVDDGPNAKMHCIIVANGARDAAGHHLNNNLGLKQAFQKRGVSCSVLAHRQATREVCEMLNALPAVTYSPYERASKDPVCGDLESAYLIGQTLASDF